MFSYEKDLETQSVTHEPARCLAVSSKSDYSGQTVLSASHWHAIAADTMIVADKAADQIGSALGMFIFHHRRSAGRVTAKSRVLLESE